MQSTIDQALSLIITCALTTKVCSSGSSTPLFTFNSLKVVCSDLEVGYAPLGVCHSQFAACKHEGIRKIHSCSDNPRQVYSYDEDEERYDCEYEDKAPGCVEQDKQLLEKLEAMVRRVDFCKKLPIGVYTAATEDIDAPPCLSAAIFCLGQSVTKVSLCPTGTFLDVSTLECVDASENSDCDADQSPLLDKLLQQYCKIHPQSTDYCDRFCIECPKNDAPQLTSCADGHIAFKPHPRKPYKCVKNIPSYLGKCSAFYKICENDRVVVHKCPANMIFDSSTFTCVHEFDCKSPA